MTATVLPFTMRSPPGIKRSPRLNLSEMNRVARALDDIEIAARRIRESKGCTGAPALEALCMRFAENAQRDAEALSAMCEAAHEADLIERESA